MPKSKQPKEQPLSVGFALDRDAAKKLEGGDVNELDRAGEIFVKSGPRFLAAPGGGGGYETRLWEKVTCDILGGRLTPADIVVNPEQLGIKVTKAAAGTKARQKKKGPGRNG
jgi:hypothetical protein